MCSIPAAIGPINDPIDIAMDCNENTVPSRFPPLRSIKREEMAGKTMPLDMPRKNNVTVTGIESRAASEKKESAIPKIPR
ncbi:hypothetical protein D1872_231880 [compost metagenome]